MGTDITIYYEKKNVIGEWETDYEVPFLPGEFASKPLDWRSYGLYGFLADVRNYSHVPVIAQPRGLPADLSAYLKDGEVQDDDVGCSASYLTLAELRAFDYEQTFEDRRCRAQVAPNVWDGASDSGAGNGKITTIREFLGPAYFESLDILEQHGIERIVFWFNS